ncbi:MAG: class I SAM-dependent methyltransferase, partial [Treponema sp.]
MRSSISRLHKRKLQDFTSTGDNMIIAATFSKPSARCGAELGKDYLRVKIKASSSAGGSLYAAEFFTKTQAFHKKFSPDELDSFIEKYAGTAFKNCVIRTESEEITILANKRGDVTRLCKPLPPLADSVSRRAGTALAAAKNALAASCPMTDFNSGNRTKNYILPEGVPVPFLVLLGIMTAEGKVVASKYAKFRQINRFLEFVDNIAPRLLAEIRVSKERPLRIADFGCGKSYLTFAVHHFFTQIKKVETEIVGLDLKQDVIDFCTRTCERLGCEGLKFDTGNIESYRFDAPPDMVITLHACDTATDFALAY